MIHRLLTLFIISLLWTTSHARADFSPVEASRDSSRIREGAQKRSVPSDRRAWGIYGGETQRSGHALTLRTTGGYELRGYLQTELAYSGAIGPSTDLGVAFHMVHASARSYGGSFRVRTTIVDVKDRIFLLLDIPITLDVYGETGKPRLLMRSLEPGFILSTRLSSRFELFYGALARLFRVNEDFMGGPEGRIGFTLSFQHFALSGYVSGTYLFFSGFPNTWLYSGTLALTTRFGREVGR